MIAVAVSGQSLSDADGAHTIGTGGPVVLYNIDAGPVVLYNRIRGIPLDSCEIIHTVLLKDRSWVKVRARVRH